MRYINLRLTYLLTYLLFCTTYKLFDVENIVTFKFGLQVSQDH